VPGSSLDVVTRDLFMACMTVERGPGELYVQGNSVPGPDVTAWVERIDPESLATVHRSPDLPGEAFWAGGMAAHVNGDLYVTFGRWCHRLDPACDVVAARRLPRARPYNSLVILPDGHLVMKDFSGGEGVGKLPGDLTGAELVVLEPDGLEIVARLELPEGSIARLSADVAPDGTPLVYVIGVTRAFRLRWDRSTATLELDDGWTTEYLVRPGQTFGWDVVLEAGSAWFLDDGEGTENFGGSFTGKGRNDAPLQLVRIPLDHGHGPPSLTAVDICGEPGGLIANPPTVDAGRSVAVGFDSSNARLSAFRFDPDDPAAPLEPLWSRDQQTAGHLLRFPDTGELLSYDHDPALGEQLVVLDIETGVERACAAIGSPVQCVVFPGLAHDGSVYATTFTTVARIRPAG
jgi:hypothetical protein